MDKLRIRIYNVLFGDAIFLSVPEEDAAGNKVVVNVLLDVGNALSGKGGSDHVFAAVLADIKRELGGNPLDLYVMTHEHMDHVQGLLYGKRKLDIDFDARHLWMTASSEGSAYYDRFPKAKQKRLAALAAYEGITTFLDKNSNAAPEDSEVRGLLSINNPQSSKDCVEHISKRGFEGMAPLYVHREAAIDGRHPFSRTKVRLLAPEEDTSIYYGALPPRTLGFVLGDDSRAGLDAGAITPPAGVSAGDFFDLLSFRANGMTANLRTIDKATNNTSVAIELEWNGWRLLFPGDAEEKSWEMMERSGLKPVHFLKVSHHGSKNGSPVRQIEKILPEQTPDDRPRFAAVSTHDDSYPGVPDKASLDLIASRTHLVDTRQIEGGSWYELLLPADIGELPAWSRGGPAPVP